MYSWKVIRSACVVLLMLPLVHLAYLVSRSTMELLDTTPAAWEREMALYAEQDANLKMPEDPVLVVGGRRVRLWRNLEDLLAPRAVLMRGLGDAIVEDLTYNYPQLIGFYRPQTLVVLPGNSEFHLRDHKSAEDFAAAVHELVDMDASYGQTEQVYIFTPLKTMLHPEDHETIDQTTALLQAMAARYPRVKILDANPLLAGPGGTPRPNYFLADGVSLSELGYLRLAVLLRAEMDGASPTEAPNNTAS